MKKILSLLLVLLLTACSSGSNFNNDEDNAEEEIDKYIEPINIDHLYDTLSSDIQAAIPEEDRQTYIYEDIGMDMPTYIVKDYYGNTVNLSDFTTGNLLIEVSATNCLHCGAQIENNEAILKETDIKIIQFFIGFEVSEDNTDEIDDFFENNDSKIPDNITVIPNDENLYKYFDNSGIEATPTFYFFKDGKLTFMHVGEMSYSDYTKFYDYSFGDKALTPEILNIRDYDDVLDDLSVASKDKLALIDNSEELTVSIIGKDVKFLDVYSEEDGAIFKLNSYRKYIDKQVVVFYLGNINNNLERDIKLVNEFKANHEDLEIIAILVDSKDISTSEAYQDLDVKLNCDVVSSLAMIPKVFIDTLINTYPAMLFIQDNKFTGGFYELEDIDEMERAYNTFLGDESIALVSNNTVGD